MPSCEEGILDGLRQAGVRLVASVPDINLSRLLTLCEEASDIQHVPLGREEEGVGVCAGAYLGGKRSALIMQNGGLLNSCNALTTTCIQFEIPVLLLIWYGGDLGDRFFQRLGEVTEPVLNGLNIRSYVLREPDRVASTVSAAAKLADASRRPVACLLTRDIMGSYR